MAVNAAGQTGEGGEKRAAAKTAAATEIAGVTLSNPDKPYFPEAAITKRDLAEYYASVAPHLLPHIAGRPLEPRALSRRLDEASASTKSTPTRRSTPP